MRGQRGRAPLGESRWRIIPARAGPTILQMWKVHIHPDHPRSCGANQRTNHMVGVSCGSSPLVRGQLQAYDADSLSERIIPARAGPTRASVHVVVFGADHPRSCGANWMIPARTYTHCGSSPLVRGQLPPCNVTRRPPRIIPARAGPTACVP